MAKQKESSWKDTILNSVGPAILGNIRNFFDSALQTVKESIKNIINFAVKKVYSAILFLTGLIFIFVGLSLLIENLLPIPKGTGFIIIGILIALSGAIVNSMTRKI